MAQESVITNLLKRYGKNAIKTGVKKHGKKKLKIKKA